MPKCVICWDDKPQNQFFLIPVCGHQFCLQCMKQQFENAITSQQINLDSFRCQNCLQKWDPILMRTFISAQHFESYNLIAIKLNQIRVSATYIQNDKEDQEFFVVAKKMGLARCPNCKAYAQKISGCNYLTCLSKQCAGKVNFCNLCDILLTPADHSTHFERNDAANGACRIKVNGAWVDKASK